GRPSAASWQLRPRRRRPRLLCTPPRRRPRPTRDAPPPVSVCTGSVLAARLALHAERLRAMINPAGRP
ncbi:hypothetical protein P7K49_003154, partial [Saguinus oedipus]